jgi:hypothetical protein
MAILHRQENPGKAEKKIGGIIIKSNFLDHHPRGLTPPALINRIPESRIMLRLVEVATVAVHGPAGPELREREGPHGRRQPLEALAAEVARPPLGPPPRELARGPEATGSREMLPRQKGQAGDGSARVVGLGLLWQHSARAHEAHIWCPQSRTSTLHAWSKRSLEDR